MPSPFSSLAATAEALVDQVFGEDFSFVPMIAPINGLAVPDQSRDAVAAFPARFDAGGSLLSGTEQGLGPAAQRRVVAEAQVIFRTALLGDVRRGDRVTRAETGRVYEVRDPRPAGHGLTACSLKEIQS